MQALCSCGGKGLQAHIPALAFLPPSCAPSPAPCPPVSGAGGGRGLHLGQQLDPLQRRTVLRPLLRLSPVAPVTTRTCPGSGQCLGLQGAGAGGRHASTVLLSPAVTMKSGPANAPPPPLLIHALHGTGHGRLSLGAGEAHTLASPAGSGGYMKCPGVIASSPRPRGIWSVPSPLGEVLSRPSTCPRPGNQLPGLTVHPPLLLTHPPDSDARPAGLAPLRRRAHSRHQSPVPTLALRLEEKGP